MTQRLAGRVFWVLLLLSSLAIAGYALIIASVPQLRANFSPLAAQWAKASPFIALTHFGGGGVALAVGMFQFSARLRAWQPALHRWLGRIYVVSVLLSGAGGLAMAFGAAGGNVARFGFGMLAVCWLVTTLQAYRAIRARNVRQHRAWMLASFSLTLAAVTLRIYLPLGQLFGIPFETAFATIAWLCWVPNLLIARWIATARPAVPV